MLERQTNKAMGEGSLYKPAYTTISTAITTTKNNLLSNQPGVSKDTLKPNLTLANNGGSLGKCKKVYL